MSARAAADVAPHLGDEGDGSGKVLRNVVLLVVIHADGPVSQPLAVEARHDRRGVDDVRHAQRLQLLQVPRRTDPACTFTRFASMS